MTQQQMLMAREWLIECTLAGCFRDIETEYEINELTDAEITQAIERHFSGGLVEFVSTC
jgi:hypothetical protein